jgi:Pre-rRNA-processing protein TSR2.
MSHSELFRNVVETVFSTWTALRLAVEHGMGGQRGKEVALEFVNQVADFFCKNDVCAEEVADFLADFMDKEFQTVCEDNSPDEVATVLCQFYQHCKAGRHDLVSFELSKFPKCEVWLCKPVHLVRSDEEAMDTVDTVTSERNSNTVIEEHDPEWTEVRSRRRKERELM